MPSIDWCLCMLASLQLGQVLHLDVLRNQIVWLMGLPAGMKVHSNAPVMFVVPRRLICAICVRPAFVQLNEDLNQKIGWALMYGIDLWDGKAFISTHLRVSELDLIMSLFLCSDYDDREPAGTIHSGSGLLRKPPALHCFYPESLSTFSLCWYVVAGLHVWRVAGVRAVLGHALGGHHAH